LNPASERLGEVATGSQAESHHGREEGAEVDPDYEIFPGKACARRPRPAACACVAGSRPQAAASAAARVDGFDGHGQRLLRELISSHALAVLDGEQGRKNITARGIIGFSASST
jgi:hypothetical protein